MSDFMTWLYAHYIQPHIKAQTMDDGDLARWSLVDTGTNSQEREDVEAVLRHYSGHAFLLGLQTGLGLADAWEIGRENG